MRKALFCACLLAVVGPKANSEDTLADAKVTVPYAELKALLSKAEAAERLKNEAPPIAAALLSSKFDLSLQGAGASLVAHFEVASFGEGWRLARLMGTDMTPVSIECTGGEVVFQEGALCALGRAPGRMSITARFDAPDPRHARGRPFMRFKTEPATSALLQATGIGKDERLRVNGSSEARMGAESIALPPGGGAVELALEEMRPPVPTRWSATAAILVERDDVFLRYSARIVADAIEGSGEEMTLELPQGSRDVVVESPGMASSNIERIPDGRDLLKISWAEKVSRSHELILRWRTAPMGDSSHWPMACPRPRGAQAFDALFVAAQPHLTVLDPEPASAVSRDVTLPDWIREKLASREYVVVSGETSLVPRRLKAAATESATVKSAKYTTTLVRDGSILGEGEFEIEHGGQARWQLRLPTGARLLKCAVGGSPTQPISGDDGGLELVLPASPRGGSSVRLSYTEKKDAMDAVGGRLSVSLPSTPLFTDRIEWQLVLPPSYEPVAVEGNLDVAKGGAALALEKRLCRGEVPAVDVHYRRTGPGE